MPRDLNIPTEIIGVPTVREPDGLALSSRNVRLTPEQRSAAVILLRRWTMPRPSPTPAFRTPTKSPPGCARPLKCSRWRRVDYAVVVDPETLQEIDTIENGALAAVAATFGKVRLIDNRLLRPSRSRP